MTRFSKCCWGIHVTSVKKRLDHVLRELNSIGTEPNESKAKSILAQLVVIKDACRETEQSPMCCFRYDGNNNIVCDSQGPMGQSEFMDKCRKCQTQIRSMLDNLNTD